MSRRMKDSGIEWIGEIPKNWEMARLRFLCKIKTGNKDTINAIDDGKYPFYVRSPKIERINSYTFNGEAILTAGDGVGAGKVFHYVFGKFDYHQRVYNLHGFKNIIGKFLFFYLRENFIKEIEKSNAKSTVDSIRLPMLLNFCIVLPSLEEQSKIAKYLDSRCNLIDQTIEKQKQVIQKLKEYKQSVITEVVTKGVNPNVPMKDSGIDFWGDIPETWELKRLKYVFYIKKNIAGEEGYNVLSITQRGIKIKDISSNEGQIAKNYSNYQMVGIGDFAMNHMDLLTGWVDVSNYEGVTSPDYRVFKLIDDKLNSRRYYLYLMQICYYNKIFYGLGQGVSTLGRWRLQADKFLNCILPVPSIDEQEVIADFIDNKCQSIDKSIFIKEKLIKKLESYKKSLIYECVTGKREVK